MNSKNNTGKGRKHLNSIIVSLYSLKCTIIKKIKHAKTQTNIPYTKEEKEAIEALEGSPAIEVKRQRF